MDWKDAAEAGGQEAEDGAAGVEGAVVRRITKSSMTNPPPMS